MDETTLSVLGSTGSIGTQTLDVAGRLGLHVAALTANRNITLLEEQARRFRPALVAVMDEAAAKELRVRLQDTSVRVVPGMEGLCEAATAPQADLVLNAVVGMVGLRPTLEAIGAHKRLALANKETLVAGGALVMEAARKNGVEILPVDSEHSAVFQCLMACKPKRDLSRIILTASGGPFFGKKREELASVTPAQALRHPNWSMGAKVTIDSATMMNKGLEVIEASWLFSLPDDRIDVVVHRESIIHSMVVMNDNAVLAQLGPADMRLPIQFALTFPRRMPSPVESLDFAKVRNLTFYEPDTEAFPCLRLCREALCRGGLAPAVANAANEQAVRLFLDGKIGFNDIPALLAEALAAQVPVHKAAGLSDILETDQKTKAFVRERAGQDRV